VIHGTFPARSPPALGYQYHGETSGLATHYIHGYTSFRVTL
jgi:hypothetical protein